MDTSPSQVATKFVDEVSQIPELTSELPEQKGISLYGIKVEDISTGNPSYLFTVPASLLLSVVCVDKKLQREPKRARIEEIKNLFLSGNFQNTIPLSAKMPLNQAKEVALDKDGRIVSLEITSPIHLADGSHRFSAFKELYEAYKLQDVSVMSSTEMEFFEYLLKKMSFVLLIFTSEKVGRQFMADAQKQLVTLNAVLPMNKGTIASFKNPHLVNLVEKHKIHSIIKDPTAEALKGSRAIIDYSFLKKAEQAVSQSLVKARKSVSKEQLNDLLEMGISVYESLSPVAQLIELVDQYDSLLSGEKDKQKLKELDEKIVALKQSTFIFSAVALQAVISLVAKDFSLNGKTASVKVYIQSIPINLFEKSDPTGQLYENEIVKAKAGGDLSISNTAKGIENLTRILYSNLGGNSEDSDED